MDERPDDDAPRAETRRQRRRDLTPRQRRRQRRAGAREEPAAAAPAAPDAQDARDRLDPGPADGSETQLADGSDPGPADGSEPETADDGPPEPVPRGSRRRRRTSGRRLAASRVRRRRARLRAIVVVVVVALVALAVVAVVTGLTDRARELVAPTEDVEVAADDAPELRQPSMLLVTYDGAEATGPAGSLVVLAVDRETGRGTVLLVPSATTADVPGYGTFQLREAHELGGPPLVDVSLANLLGIRFDGVASLSAQGWAALLTRTGGFEIEVGRRLVEPGEDGGQVRFEPGRQFLDGPRLAEYLTFRGEGETELEALPRVQQVLGGLLDQLAEDPALLDELFVGDAPMVETTDPELLRVLLAELAEARAQDLVTTVSLPVTALGTGREDSYRLDTERAEQLVGDRLAASRPTDGAGAGRGVQILNGNGVPGIGQQVAERLGDGGYRVVLTGNADRFTYDTTRIVVHDADDEQLAVAGDIRDRLGVGEIERSGTPQSVVDVTIIVGADFPPDGS